MGMGLGPIPWDKMVQYTDRYHLEEDIAEAFIAVMREMDSAYLDWNEKNKPKPEHKPTPQAPRSNKKVRRKHG